MIENCTPDRRAEGRVVPGTLARVGRCVAGLAALGAALAVSAPSEARSQDEVVGDRAFHVYDTQIARATAEQVLDHLASGRASEALAELQGLLEEHGGAVLRLAPVPVARGQVQSDTFVGVERWSLSLLRGLPASTLQLYRDRHRDASERALEEARLAGLAGDWAPLLAVARRWPVTPAAGRAWIAVGDLLLERGDVDEARASWLRAATAFEPSLASALERALAGSEPRGGDP